MSALLAFFTVPLFGGLMVVGGFAIARLRVDAAALFDLGFLAVALMVFVFGLPGVITSFFADRTLLLLAAAPLPVGAVFAERLVTAALPALGASVFVFAGAAGFGVGARAGPDYFLLALVMVATVPLAMIAVAVLLMTAVLRVVPAERARDVASLLAALLGVSLYLVQFLLQPGRFARVAGGGRTISIAEPVAQMAAVGEALRWLPTSWPAEALTTWVRTGPAPAAPWTALSLGFLVAVWGAAWWSYGQTFVLGLGVFGEAGAAAARSRAPGRRRAAQSARSRPRPVWAIAHKDLLSLRRDLRRLTRLLPAVAIAFVYAVVNSRRVGSGIWQVILPLALVPVLSGSAFGLPAVVSEGRGILLLVSAGVTPSRILLAKLTYVTPIVTGLTLAAGGLLVALQGGSLGELAAVVAIALWLGAGCSVIAVAIGSYAPDFERYAQRGHVGGLPGFGGLIAMAAYAGLTYGAIAAHLAAPAAGRWSELVVILSALSGLIAVGLVVGSTGLALILLALMRPAEP